MKPNVKKLLIYLAVPLAVGGLAALLSGGMSDYKELNQPPFSPPGWIFPIVWSILYLLMGYASYRIATTDAATQPKQQALTFYGVQLFFNFLWPIVFFGFHAYLPAFIVLLVLWILVVITMWKFDGLDTLAGTLLLPYLLWITFAGYLNLGVYLLN